MTLLTVINGNQLEFAAEKDRKKNKIIGINAQRKDISIHEDKVFSHFKAQASTIDEVLEELRNLETQKKTFKNEINLKDIFDLVQSESAGLSLNDIFSLCFNENELLKKIALYEKLLEDRIFFKHKADLFVPKDSQEVEDNLKQIEILKQKQAQKNHEEEQVFSWLKEYLAQKEKPQTPDYVENYLNLVKNFCIYGDDFNRKNQAIELLKKIADETGYNIEGNLNFAAFKLLKELKLVEEDENLLLKKHSISLHFDEAELQEARTIHSNFLIRLDGKQDFRHLFTFSIDDQDTKDIDDAFSFIETNDTYQFLIHIADVAEIIPVKSQLDEISLKKTSSIYLPDLKIPMLPQNLSEDLCSLVEGKDRYALTYLVQTDKNFNILTQSICQSVIQVTRNLNYEEMDEILAQGTAEHFPIYDIFYQFAKIFQNQRLNQWKGIDFLFPSVYPKVQDKEIRLKYYNPLSKSNLLVKEFMVLANFIAADYCKKNEIPAIYICQDAPDNHFELQNRAVTDKIQLQEFVKYMKKSYLSAHPSRHFALGLPVYTQSTSPIRRVLDLIIQRQIKAFLSQTQPAYTGENILELKTNIELLKPIISNLEDESNKYWLLKYLLLNFRNKPIDALVVKELPDGYLVELDKTLTNAKIITRNELKIGEKVKVKLHTILPRLGLTLGNF